MAEEKETTKKEVISESVETSSKTKDEDFGLNVEEMMAEGMHLGHRISRLHPKMARFVLGIKNTVHILDLRKTEIQLNKALSFLKELFEKGGTMIIIGTKPPLRKLIKETAQKINFPYVTERWLGGTFTNFKVIFGRVKYFKTLAEQKENRELEKYSKKERIKKEKELIVLSKKFEGLKDLQQLPDAVFICDVKRDGLALKEAKEVGVKVVAICDTNVDPSQVDYPIPANDDAISSVKYILEKVLEVIKKYKK